MSENKSTIEITGCETCPCCDALDMSSGYKCKLVDEQEFGYIKENKWFMPDTPNWCPLKLSDITLSLKK